MFQESAFLDVLVTDLLGRNSLASDLLEAMVPTLAQFDCFWGPILVQNRLRMLKHRVVVATGIDCFPKLSKKI